MKRYVLVLLGFFLFVGCGGSSGGGNTEQNNSIDLPAISINQVIIKSTALEATTLDLSKYSTVNILSSNTIGSTGQTTTEFAKANKGQSLFVSDENDEPIAVAYFSASQIDSGSIDITVESLADGIIMSNPLMLGYVISDREAILEQIKITDEYDIYIAYIETVLSESPTQLLNEEQYPKVFEDSITLILNAIDGLGGNSAKVLKTTVEPMGRTFTTKSSATPSPIIGDDDGPYLADVSGDNIIAVNPTMVFYGIDVEDQAPQLIAGKEAAFALIDKNASKPVEEEVFVGDGNRTWTYIKNDFGSAAGILSGFANILKTACLIVDLKADCPIKNDTIEKIVEPNGSISSDAKETLTEVGKDLLEGALIGTSYYEEFAKIMSGEKGNIYWGQITRLLYKNADDVDGATNFFINGKKFFKNSAKILKKIGAALKVYGVVQKFLPYTWDLVSAPKRLTWCINQVDGVLDSTTTCSYQPPTAAFSYTPSSDIYIGDQVSFDASTSSDPIYDSTTLEYKWDLNGDGIIDSDWTTVNTANYTYSSSNVYSILLYVRNPDGIEDIIQMEINVVDNTIDSDGDGIADDVDFCPDTPDGETVDENGCSESQLESDTDGDGVVDSADTCPETPSGEAVDENGCSESHLNKVIETIAVGGYPSAVVVAPDGKQIYVSSSNSDTISIIQTSDNTVIDTVSVDEGPGGIVILPNGNYVYVANLVDDTVSIIRTLDNSVVGTMDLGDDIAGIASSVDGSYVYITNIYLNNVSVIRTSDNTIIDTITAGETPIYTTVSPDGKYIYISDSSSNNNVLVIRTSDNTVIDTISVGEGPNGIAVSPDGKYIYVANQYADTLSVVRTADKTLIKTVTVGDEPKNIAISPDGNYVYVTNTRSDNVSVIRASDNTVIESIYVGNNPIGIAISPDGNYVYVANKYSNSVSILGR